MGGHAIWSNLGVRNYRSVWLLWILPLFCYWLFVEFWVFWRLGYPLASLLHCMISKVVLECLQPHPIQLNFLYCFGPNSKSPSFLVHSNSLFCRLNSYTSSTFYNLRVLIIWKCVSQGGIQCGGGWRCWVLTRYPFCHKVASENLNQWLLPLLDLVHSLLSILLIRLLSMCLAFYIFISNWRIQNFSNFLIII